MVIGQKVRGQLAGKAAEGTLWGDRTALSPLKCGDGMDAYIHLYLFVHLGYALY